MVSRHYSVKCALAIGLALSFIWIGIACVSLCSLHRAEKQKPHRALTNLQIECADETDCCPILTTPISSLPERPLIAPHISSNHHDIFIVPAYLTSCPAGNAVYTSGGPSASDPPFERLCALRI
jgi:hypothetical protein